MSQSLNGFIVTGPKESVSIARDADFIDLLTYSPPETKFRVLEKLKELCVSFGEMRTPATDLYRQRLSQLREHMRTA